MISVTWKIDSSILDFHVDMIQFILHKQVQNDMGDRFKTLSLHPLKPTKEGIIQEERKENCHYLLEVYCLVGLT